MWIFVIEMRSVILGCIQRILSIGIMVGNNIGMNEPRKYRSDVQIVATRKS